MEEFKVRYAMHVRDAEQRTQIRAEECRTMIEGMARTAEVKRRYLRRFGSCLSEETARQLLASYERLTVQAAAQRRKLARVLYKPPVQLEFDNCY